MALLQDIEAFLEMHEISATALGHQALRDRHFVRQLRAGRRVWPETEAKVRQFMSEYVADHGAADSADMEEVSRGKAGDNFPAPCGGALGSSARPTVAVAEPGGDGSASGESGFDQAEAAE
jgi:hypothetical protein